MSLLFITFFASIQYIFYAGVPSNFSNFGFLFITSLIGFIILFLVFFNELFRIDRKHIMQCLILSVESLAYNFFLLLGANSFDSTTVSSIVSSYFLFIPIIEFLLYKTMPKPNVIVAIVFVVIGVFLIMGMDYRNILNPSIIFLIITDIIISLNIITIGKFAKGSNPAILAMGQLFFNTIFAFICFAVESKIKMTSIRMPREPLFWGSVIFISFFLRGLYTVVQVYAQRYTSPINVSLIFSTELIMTLFFSNFISNYFGFPVEPQAIGLMKIIGVVLMLIGIFLSDNDIRDIYKIFYKKKKLV